MIIRASWDDGASTDLRMADLMSKYRIETTFYWPSQLGRHKNPGLAKQWLNENECKTLAARFRVGSHSATHQFMKKLSIEQILTELNDSRKHWQDVTGQPVDSFAYPKNSYTNLVKVLLPNAGYTEARTPAVGVLHGGDDPYQTPCTVQIGIDRVEYQGVCWEMFARQMIEKITPDSVFHLFGNSWEVDEFGDWDALEELLKELTALRL